MSTPVDDAYPASTAPTAVDDILSRMKAALSREFAQCRWFYSIFGIWLAITIGATFILGDTLALSVRVYAKRLEVISMPALSLLATALAVYMILNRGQQSLGVSVSRFYGHVNRDGRVLRIVAALASYVLFMACFLYWKMKIPTVNPFSWDKAFADADAWLFGGRQGWEVLHPWLSGDTVTRALDANYGFWGMACLFFWVAAAASNRLRPEIRSQYWLATLMTWLLVGLVSATLLSSAGPVYYHHVTGDAARYEGLTAFLASFNGSLVSTNVQDILWSIHAGEVNGAGGISAMPSMHNAQSLLFILLARHLGRPYLVFAVAFTAAIFVGSVHLGWHYAVDALVSFALVPPIWYAASRLTGIHAATARAV